MCTICMFFNKTFKQINVITVARLTLFAIIQIQNTTKVQIFKTTFLENKPRN